MTQRCVTVTTARQPAAPPTYGLEVSVGQNGSRPPGPLLHPGSMGRPRVSAVLCFILPTHVVVGRTQFPPCEDRLPFSCRLPAGTVPSSQGCPQGPPPESSHTESWCCKSFLQGAHLLRSGPPPPPPSLKVN